jgi:NADPH:quinone reductase
MTITTSGASMPHHHAIVVNRPGGPDVLTYTRVATPTPGRGELLVDVAVAGVNFMDTGTRTGQNGPGPFPITPGVEGAGRVVALGEGVSEFEIGQRVAWQYTWGSYAERLILPTRQAIPVPDDIDDDTAASLLMQGLTAQHLVDGYYPIQHGDTVLIHAAAGGVGLLTTQLARRRGARVIARVSSQAKAAMARDAGATEVIIDSTGTFADQVLAMTNGVGVRVVYDGSGTATFADSIKSLAVHGVMAYYGNTLETVAPVELTSLPNSIRVGYPNVFDHVRTRDALLTHTGELFDLVRTGQLKITIGARYPLAHADQAHTDLQNRTTIGKLLLTAPETSH